MEYQQSIQRIKEKVPLIQKEDFVVAEDGTHHDVFLSRNFIIRFRDDMPQSLSREAGILNRIDNDLVPKVLWIENTDELAAMVENRLPGKPMHAIWKTLPAASKLNIAKQIVEFLNYLRTQKSTRAYSVHTGKEYQSFWHCLTDGIDYHILNGNNIEKAGEMINDLLSLVNREQNINLFADTGEIGLVHGDLIIHNLLTDGKSLTGVLDWELALYGDHHYDISRLLYYQGCAKAYQEQGTDESFESEFMDMLIAEIMKSDLIGDKKMFNEKNQIMRAIFYLRALQWATESEDRENNVNEIVSLWNKKRIRQKMSNS